MPCAACSRTRGTPPFAAFSRPIHRSSYCVWRIVYLHRAYSLSTLCARVPLLGLVQSLFEGAMYTFVFLWSPSLAEQTWQELPFGLIFASFMVAIMIGSGIFTFLIRRFSPERIALGNLVYAALCLSVPIVSQHVLIRFAGFLAFEISWYFHPPPLLHSMTVSSITKQSPLTHTFTLKQTHTLAQTPRVVAFTSPYKGRCAARLCLKRRALRR